MAVLILAFTASVITWQNQIAFKYAQASNIIPVAQVPIQISPILVYFLIFRADSSTRYFNFLHLCWNDPNHHCRFPAWPKS